ncbi:uncharacterized protein LOC131056354 [Cryptomeria japonica]|uniref:uncharacterized protein LOC131056354 n=1 Tax=Cryptomeria japonica TaxID=3369 RepID=UPI0027D9FEF6|nr:uncharacterized protein LOC131056354 [Cryptomeria japonica]XP_057846695.2 uncharacterized protein LOC131056354 [Cryptomeria japonica]XP_057846696.2 uncharacterized protein LOC131056354 [Cryptomeria japonica]
MDTKPLTCLSNLSINSEFYRPSINSLSTSNNSLRSWRYTFKHIYSNSCKILYSNSSNHRPLESHIVLSSSHKKVYFTEGFYPNRGRKQTIVVKLYPRFNGGGGGGGERNETERVVFNLAMAGALTYLTVTGKMGWVFDAIVSLSLFAVLVPVAGVVVFLWFAGREMVQGNCPNCGNEFQVFRFDLTDGPQLCPYCTQPFELEEFVRESPRFSTDRFGNVKQPFGGFTSGQKEQDPSEMVVDVEAEVKDKD